MERQAIEDWVKQNAEGLMPEMPLTSDEISHISMCMEHILKWYHEGYPLGDFLTAIVRNDFKLACVKADSANRKALYLYALFLYNKLDADYLTKAEGK